MRHLITTYIGDTDIDNINQLKGFNVIIIFMAANSSTSLEVRTIAYMEDRQLQHLQNVNMSQTYNCSSEEKTLFQYTSHHAEILGQFLVQMQLGRQQILLYKEISP